MYKIIDTLPDVKTIEIYQCGRGQNGYKIYNLSIGFDIETTNHKPTKGSFMWVWSVNWHGCRISGRTWDDFFKLLWDLKQIYRKADVMIFVQNLPFEASFLLPRLEKSGEIKRIFATDKRQVVEIRTHSGYIFRDTAVLSGMSLQAIASNFCDTQKAVGELDYNKLRNSTTPINNKEWHYIFCDTRILYEYGLQVHHEYTAHGKTIPYTSTGKVRKILKDNIGGKNLKWVRMRTAALYPDTLDEYRMIILFLFRGGYVHAQTAACNKVLNLIQSWDENSAYPAVMLQCIYPMGVFEEFSPSLFEYFLSRDDKIAIYGCFTFYNVTPKTAHCIESKHKIISEKNAFYENGRLSTAEEITVLLTDVDFRLYQMFYNWTSYTVHWCKKTVKKPLPDYLRKTVDGLYAQKMKIKHELSQLKKDGKENTDEYNALQKLYTVTKGNLNACYGMTVSRLNMELYDYKDGEWVSVPQTKKDGSIKTYDDYIQEQVLSPYWGIYITAYARQRVLTAFDMCGRSAKYGDTDSVKVTKGCEHIFEDLNTQIDSCNILYCKQHNLDYNLYKGLGCFELEDTYTHFKTLGAKRYIYTIKNKKGKQVFHSTVAGMPKAKLEKKLQNLGIKKGFAFFDNGMTFEDSGKMTHYYHEEVTADINGEIMHEYGGCYLEEAPFKMTIAEAFLDIIAIRTIEDL